MIKAFNNLNILSIEVGTPMATITQKSKLSEFIFIVCQTPQYLKTT